MSDSSTGIEEMLRMARAALPWLREFRRWLGPQFMSFSHRVLACFLQQLTSTAKELQRNRDRYRRSPIDYGFLKRPLGHVSALMDYLGALAILLVGSLGLVLLVGQTETRPPVVSILLIAFFFWFCVRRCQEAWALGDWELVALYPGLARPDFVPQTVLRRPARRASVPKDEKRIDKRSRKRVT